MRFTKIKKASSLLYFALALYSAFLLVSCVPTNNNGGANSNKPLLLSPQDEAVNVEFNNAVLKFRTPTNEKYELVVKEAVNNVEVYKTVVDGNGDEVSVVVPKGKLKPTVRYKWYVRLRDDDSVASDVWYFNTKNNTPPSVSNLKPDKTSDHPFGALALTWSATDPDNDDLTFEVKVYLLGKTEPVFTTTVATNSAVVKNLEQQKDYEWTVKAKDPWGSESSLTRATFRTKTNEAPQNIELLNPKNGQVGVKFNNLLLQWEGYDKDYEELKYNVSLNDSQNLLSGSTLTQYRVTGLKPDTLYRLKITAIDTYGLSKTQEFTFTTKQNSPPNKPTLLEPANNSRVNFAKITSLTFRWLNSVDPDEDTVSYDFVIESEGNVVVSREGINSTSQIFSDPKSILDVGKTYAWYVVAKDPHGGKTQSEKFTFETYENNPPTKPTSPYPANGAINQPNRIPKFSWQSSDPDGDPLKFDVYIGNSPSNLSLVTATDLTTTSFETGYLFEFGKTYYWKVAVKDGYNPPVESDVWSFTITNKDNPPTQPVLVNPANGSTGIALNNVTLKWNASSDVETSKENLVYYLYFGRADNMTLLATITGRTTAEIEHIATGLKPVTTYYWRVEVKDSFGNYAYSTTWNFTTKQNEAPNFPINPSPSDGGSITSSSTPATITLSWSCSDPDGDALTYEVYVSRTTDFTGVAPIRTNMNSVQYTAPDYGWYYWYVVAKDPHGGATKGKTWKFEIKK
ncbi:MAG: hypothetical protein WHS64_06265 [Fervidobacterium sp.]|uniref:Fibronectin type-III domain-containing protein n=1 Tax=Fervidobacterium gondwanense DSM 13020 TaxID=1121883 RepID=A0A1M7RTP7_FERGO|nr:fibronectin type III domain-containing protein [Fervidobacterium gondwanense]SHN49412.1 hypothetical protein SAMN02745226_00129 [Fervidobacterium gondwanense DSM 13020]